MKRSPLKGWHGWALIAAGVVALDILAVDGETLSAASHRGMDKHPALISALIGVTAAHLSLGRYSHWSRIDPFQVLEYARKVLAHA